MGSYKNRRNHNEKNNDVTCINRTCICIYTICIYTNRECFRGRGRWVIFDEYEVLKADSDSTSIGNDYFEKPATLIVEGGEKHIQLTVNHSDYVKSLSGPQGEVGIVSEDKEKKERVVKFEVDELSKPIEMEMHISFELEDQGYDQTHKARFDFNTDSMEPVGSKAKKADKTEAKDDKDHKNEIGRASCRERVKRE